MGSYYTDESFEDRYLDVLQNLEMGVVAAFRRNPELLDAHAEMAYEALIRYYKAEARGREPRVPNLPAEAEEVFKNVHSFAEFRLGRESFVEVEAGAILPEPITVEELVKCLKRLRKSVGFWTKQGGRRGYLKQIGELLGPLFREDVG
jgi:hypothetical protein